MSPPAGPPIWATGVCDGLVAAGSRHVVYVPDNPLSHVLHDLGARHTNVRTTLATREEEAFGIAAGVFLGGGRPTVLLQSSGLGNSVNALASLLVAFRLPALVVISMRGDAGEWNPTQEPMGRAVAPILDALSLPHETAADDHGVAALITRLGRAAFETRRAHTCLLPRRMTAPAPVAAR